jgi:gamma-glutamylcyclotransferase
MNVFAYGSNMPIRRMCSRVAGATVVATGYVCHRQFAYHKRGVDGSAKADAVFTGRGSDRIWGVVYRLAPDEKQILDRHETLGVGYDHEQVEVIAEERICQAWIYVARREAIDARLLPYSWYHKLVIHGAEQHRLPQPYIEQLRQFQSIKDPDAARHDRNRRLIS